MTEEIVYDLAGLLKTLEDGGFWGELVIRYQGGRIVLLEKKETFKPVDMMKVMVGIEGLRG